MFFFLELPSTYEKMCQKLKKAVCSSIVTAVLSSLTHGPTKITVKSSTFHETSNSGPNQTMSSTTTTPTPVVAAASGKVYKVQRRVGRGVPVIPELYTKRCSCRRDKTIVFCRACGYYCHGRIRLKCEQHPRVTFLLDIAECPRCHSSVFLDEHFIAA